MKINPIIIMREEFDGSGILFDPENNRALTINKMGVLIWHALEVSGLTEYAVQKIMNEYPDALLEDVENDVDTFISKLKENDLAMD